MKKLLAFIAFVCSLSLFPVQASANSTASPIITKIIAEQKEHQIWLTVWHKAPSLGIATLTLTQPQFPGSTYRRTESVDITYLEGWWKFYFSTYSAGQEGTYSFTAQLSMGSTVSAPFTFSFAYSKPIPPTWKQAGCDDLRRLNREALEWDYDSAWWANHEVRMQNMYPSVSKFGCPNKLAWKWRTVKVQEFVWQYTLCNDGWHSSSTGRGTCSWHGGINSYRGYYKTVSAKRALFYWKY